MVEVEAYNSSIISWKQIGPSLYFENYVDVAVSI
jgi:hypothetical protein